MNFRFWTYDDDYKGTEARAEAEAREIIPGLWYFGSYHFGAYLMHTGAGPVAIDTCHAKTSDFFFAQFSRAGIDPASVAAVLHTHAHLDHIGNSARLVSLSGAAAWIGAEDAPALAKEVEVAGELREGQELDFGGTRIRFCHTPGHTPGCGMLLAELAGRRLCCMGDAGGPYIFQTVRWEGDVAAFLASAEKMKGVEADLYLPGHPHQILQVSPEGDPRLSQEQWHRYIDERVAMMQAYVSRAQP